MSKNNDLVIWRDIAVPIFHKTFHIRHIGDRGRYAFTKDCGDVPSLRFNSITGRIEEVVNNRGRAYAARRRLKYRNKKHRS